MAEKSPSLEQASSFHKLLVKAVDSTSAECINKNIVKVNSSRKLLQLGPCYRKEIPPEVEEVLLAQKTDTSPYFRGGSWSKWEDKHIAWPATYPEWVTWVHRVEANFGEVWKKLGIHDAIMITTAPPEMDRSMMAAALCFWSSTSNAMELRFGALSPTLMDLAAIVGLSPHDLIVDACLDDLKLEVNLTKECEKRALKLVLTEKGQPEIQTYSHWIEAFNDGKRAKDGKSIQVSAVEHAAFLVYWLSRFIVCTDSGKITTEYFRLAEFLASKRVHESGRSVAMGPFVLALLYRCLHQIVTGDMEFCGGGPIWIMQLWLQVYFPSFRQPLVQFVEDKALGLQLATLKPMSHTTESCFDHLFSCPEFNVDQYAVCITRKYPSYLAVDMSEEPKDDAKGRAAWRAWRSAIIGRDLYVGTIGSQIPKCGVELYSPALFGRQLGFVQGIPRPELPSTNLCSSYRYPGRKEAKDNKADIAGYRKSFKCRWKACSRFPWVRTSGSSRAFSRWWSKRMAPRFGQGLEKARASALSNVPWDLKKKEMKTSASRNLKRCSSQTTSPASKKRRAPSISIEDQSVAPKRKRATQELGQQIGEGISDASSYGDNGVSATINLELLQDGGDGFKAMLHASMKQLITSGSPSHEVISGSNTQAAIDVVKHASTMVRSVFMEKVHLDQLRDAMDVLVEAKHFLPLVRKELAEFINKANAMAGLPQKKEKKQLELQTCQQLQLSASELYMECARMAEAIKAKEARMDALQAELQAETNEWKYMGKSFMNKMNSYNTQNSQLAEKTKLAESILAEIAKLESEEEVVEAAFVSLKSLLSGLSGCIP